MHSFLLHFANTVTTRKKVQQALQIERTSRSEYPVFSARLENMESPNLEPEPEYSEYPQYQESSEWPKNNKF